ncbi:acyl-CoA thioesterase [Nocardioides solisilvae]|uniref:acyl-CoA thioesterase n=1 Tax=Nocardioides solisilvae TaxID=1542435 RepID=UPI000D74587D|nr:acyl-CoA thioesterase domain-containing protein [Nocardioides solisilvae]
MSPASSTPTHAPASEAAVTLDELLRLLTLREEDGYAVGQPQQHPEDRVFGGLLLAQAVVAAGRSVPAHHRPFTLQADFVAGVPTDEPLRWRVDHVSEAASLTTRRTTLVAPDGSERFTALSRWGSVRDDLADHRPAAARAAPAPEELPGLPERFGDDERIPRWWRAERPVHFRHTEAPPYVETTARQDHQSAWLRTTSALPDDPVVHAAVVAYVTDMSILEGAFRALGSRRHAPGSRILSLTHTLAWHAHPDLSSWHQFDSEVRAVAHGRTQGEGRIFDRDGHHVVTAGQVGLVRLA